MSRKHHSRNSPRPASGFPQAIRDFYSRHCVSPDFPKQVLREADFLSPSFSIRGRKDLRAWNTFTIDPEEARDFDDALSISQDAEGRWIAGVHIADVSHWVWPGGWIDREARRRATSLYFPWGYVPMLPERLTSGLCSLRPGEDRLTVSCLFTLKDNEIIHWEFCPSVICSQKRLTYSQAQYILEGKVPETEPWLNQSLHLLHAAGLRLREKRDKRGGLSLNLPEYGVRLDLEGNPSAFFARESLETNKLVEDWMLAANEAVASFLAGRRAAFLYRNHEKPPAEDLAEFGRLCRVWDLPARGKTPAERFRGALRAAESRPHAPVFFRQLIRTLAKAKYEEKNKGHFGIGATAYTHFTSPIRRYPDLVAHRVLLLALSGKTVNPKQKKSRFHREQSELHFLGVHCSEMEESSMKMEREAYKWMGCRFLIQKIGEEFTGVVTGLHRMGLFVELTDFPIEGLLLRHTLRDDSYSLDEGAMAYVGKRSGKRLGLGAEIRVKLIRIDADRRQIDFAQAGGTDL